MKERRLKKKRRRKSAEGGKRGQKKEEAVGEARDEGRISISVTSLTLPERCWALKQQETAVVFLLAFCACDLSALWGGPLSSHVGFCSLLHNCV